jgi:glycosyltransferase involved in cell wall biosynthesis
MATVSVITITLNEERNIEACLQGVRWADEIIVLDSGSTDRTMELAKRYTNRVERVEWKGYGGTRNMGLDRASADWILWLDADERGTDELAAEIQEILRADDPAIAGYAVARRAYFLGRWIRHCGWYPSRVIRLFRRRQGRFTESRVHEELRVNGGVSNSRGDLVHYTDPDLHHYFEKFNRYTTLAAEDMKAAGRTCSIYDLLVRPSFTFVKMYLLRLGVMDGMAGFVLCVCSSAYVFTKYAKLWELTRNRHDV